jgi:PAS domain S-box-containing protein
MREPARRGDVPRQAQIAADAGEYVFESVHQRKDGTTFPVIIHVSVLKDAAGVPLYRAATVQDITDRKRTEQALRASEEQLRLVTDAIPALISYVDAELRYRFVNRQYEVWFQRPRSEVLGRHMEEILGEVAFARLKPHLDAALRGEMVEFEVEAPYRSGRTRWIHAHYIPHRNREGVVVGLMVLVLDTTERRRMEESLARAHAELEQHNRTLDATVQDRTAKLREVIGELEAFSYSIAHDMRAPLRSMQGFSRLLLEDHAAQLDDEGRSFLKRIIASADRLDRLIQDVLNYSKVVRSDLPLEPVDLETLIKEIIGSYPNLQAPQATITVQPPLPRVLGNSAALTQVVSNLLGNAVKFVKSGTHPQVRIWAEAVAAEPGAAGDTGAVRIWFEDNGIGIPKDSQHRLFAMFQRLNRPELYEGTGIGLAIVRKAVERMGGTLGVESETGAGSRFWVQLRRADTA